MKTNPSYFLPSNLMAGIECQQIKVKLGDNEGLDRAVEAACIKTLDRSGGKGFPVLFYYSKMSVSSVMATLQRVFGASALLYTHGGSEKNEATEVEVEEWLRRWRTGEEKRILVTDPHISRGWEAKDLVVIGKGHTENLVMRTCGFCFLIKVE